MLRNKTKMINEVEKKKERMNSSRRFQNDVLLLFTMFSPGLRYFSSSMPMLMKASSSVFISRSNFSEEEKKRIHNYSRIIHIFP